MPNSRQLYSSSGCLHIEDPQTPGMKTLARRSVNMLKNDSHLCPSQTFKCSGNMLKNDSHLCSSQTFKSQNLDFSHSPSKILSLTEAV
ncbi:uncharacterized protein PHALS_15064 [Plasmopara halstedii]|uniref:Uncharacterized protein n=1 Tax=Plasmopara halstedii TaxID=4781 RepID=A0A0P1AAD5_PLAHL|nr:uncharacterized protein PHALS_15064 [Plasmopara halstedii]CEG37342.1 hypothetical protein PHALS_15064 [Plasmopara halstedii]|eukprot:XP_024573711.1 hypothetical protein PHALS_15064 [Plasmopara halstedii]